LETPYLWDTKYLSLGIVVMARKSKKTIPIAVQMQNAALELAALQGWANVTMADIAKASDINLGDALQTYRSTSAVVFGFLGRLDETMLSMTGTPDSKESARDRLFDIIMNRFDNLNPHKSSLIAIARAQKGDPVGGVCLLIRHKHSLVLMLEAAGISTSGIRGTLLIKGLALVYANAVRVWIDDDSKDMAKTMAAVDQGLGKAEKIANRLKMGA
jgi:AcrR family transcriptional regulator